MSPPWRPYIIPVTTATAAPITNPVYRFLNGTRTRTVRTTRFSIVRVRPSANRSTMDVSVAELKNPLILRAPEGASFLSSWTRVITPGDSACTLDQSGMCFAAQGGRRNSNNRSASPVAVCLKRLLLFLLSRVTASSS